ncbi:hypothetical protein THAOC_27712, partial [Thalassiosira oceanica]
ISVTEKEETASDHGAAGLRRQQPNLSLPFPPPTAPKIQDGDEDNNDYERDGFVVGEDEAIEWERPPRAHSRTRDSEDEDEGAEGQGGREDTQR